MHFYNKSHRQLAKCRQAGRETGRGRQGVPRLELEKKTLNPSMTFFGSFSLPANNERFYSKHDFELALVFRFWVLGFGFGFGYAFGQGSRTNCGQSLTESERDIERQADSADGAGDNEIIRQAARRVN